MRSLLVAFLVFAYIIEAQSITPPGNKSLLDSLDAAIANQDYYALKKEQRISELIQRSKDKKTDEERYTMNSLLYDEYYVYDADSAINMAKRNKFIARRLHKTEWEMEWRIKLSFVYAATGLLTEAQAELQAINSETLTKSLRVEYYRQWIYIYSHLMQYSGNSETARYYQRQNELYKDSIMAHIQPSDPLYQWEKAWGPDPLSVKKQLEAAVRQSNLDSRIDAMNAYSLSHVCLATGDEEGAIRYLILSGIADVRSCNRDIASLEELAKVLYQQGDIDHSYKYLNYCLSIDRAYHNRVRMVSLMEILSDIHSAWEERNSAQQNRVRTTLIAVSVLCILLISLIFYIARKLRQLNASRAMLNTTNNQLATCVQDLQEARADLSDANGKLSALNAQLQDSNNQLRESNYVKEEIIGYVFSVCSNYISKLEDFRLRIHRQVKTKQYDELRRATETPMAQAELKAFFQTFDEVFLHIYPDFIQDLNALLRPEERICVKEGELLNTELRIYALVRLGITDSVKIAEFLHCSAQTVYNNRMRTRNKAIIPKTEFARTVQSLGKRKKA